MANYQSAYTGQQIDASVSTAGTALAATQANAASIATLTTAVNGKASQSDLNTLSGTVSTISGKVTTLETTMPTKADKTALAKTDRSLKALWELNEGQTYQFETDDDAGDKTVPTGAKLCSALSIGGMSRKGYQLIPYPYVDSTKTVNGVTFTVKNDGGVEISGSATAISVFRLKIKDNIKATDGTYTLHGGNNVNTDYGLRANFYDADNNQLAVMDTVNGTMTKTVSGGVDYFAVTIMVRVGYPNGTVTIYPMLEKGTIPHEYEPYTDELIDAPVDSIEIAGRNVFDGIMVTGEWKDGGVFNPNNTSYVANKNPIHVKSGQTYYIKHPSVGHWAEYLDSDKNGVGVGFGIPSNNLLTIPSGVEYLCFTFVTGNYAADAFCVNISDSKNGTWTPYRAPVTFQIDSAVKALPCYGIGINSTLYNYIEQVDGKWYYHKRVGSVDLGTLGWNWYSGGGGFYICATITTLKQRTTNLLAADYQTSNTYIVGSGDFVDRTIATYGGDYDNGVLYLKDDRYTTVTGENVHLDWLDGKKLYYELATEVVTDITQYFADGWGMAEVEANGTIAYNYPNKATYTVSVPNTVEYAVKLSEVG